VTPREKLGVGDEASSTEGIASEGQRGKPKTKGD